MPATTAQLRAARRLRENLQSLEAVAFDVDGVLTDGTLLWSPAGEEFKTFSSVDIMGITLLRRLGLQVALVSAESGQQIDRYAQRMRIPLLVKGARDKAAAVRQLALQMNLALENVCFFGDDIPDLFAMEACGLCACPSSAVTEVRAFVAERGFLSSRPGGHGAVRELADAVLEARQVSARELLLRRPGE